MTDSKVFYYARVSTREQNLDRQISAFKAMGASEREIIVDTNVWKRFKRIAVSIGSEKSRFHDLRHSFATLSIEAGSDIKTVSESLGHATTAFTMDVYGHTSERMQQEQAQKLQAHISSLL